jgi:hypothetical protein
MTQFTVDPELLVALARRLDAVAVDLAQSVEVPGADAVAFGSGAVQGAVHGFFSHQADGIRALHDTLANAGTRLGEAAHAYRGTDSEVAAAACGCAR